NAAHGGESTNCHARLAEDVDWHMPLTAHVGEGEDVAIIVETTPRVRREHASWTTARLKPWTAHVGSHANPNYNRQKVRISGWLMLDPEHQRHDRRRPPLHALGGASDHQNRGLGLRPMGRLGCSAIKFVRLIPH